MIYQPYQRFEWHRDLHETERFSPVLPFLAGLAVSPFLFGGYGGGYGPGYGLGYGPYYGVSYGPQYGPFYGYPYRLY